MKLRHVDISELETSLRDLLSEVEEKGELLMITRDGTPVLEIRPHPHFEHRAKKSWTTFFELAKKTTVPEDFLSQSERDEVIMNDAMLDEAIRQAMDSMPLEQRKKLLDEALKRAGLFSTPKR